MSIRITPPAHQRRLTDEEVSFVKGQGVSVIESAPKQTFWQKAWEGISSKVPFFPIQSLDIRETHPLTGKPTPNLYRGDPILPPFTHRGHQDPPAARIVGPPIISGVTDLGARMVEDYTMNAIQLFTRTLPGLLPEGSPTREFIEGVDLIDPMRITSFGLGVDMEEGRLRSAGEEFMDGIDRIGLFRPDGTYDSSKLPEALVLTLASPVSKIFDLTIAGSLMKSFNRAILKQPIATQKIIAFRELGKPKNLVDARKAARASKELAMSRARAQGLSLKDVERTVAEVANRNNEALKVLQKQGIPTAEEFARGQQTFFQKTVRDIARTLETELGDLTKVRVMKGVAEVRPERMLPGFRPVPGQPRPFGLSIQEVQRVGGNSMVTKAHGARNAREFKRMLTLDEKQALRRADMKPADAWLSTQLKSPAPTVKPSADPLAVKARKYESAKEFEGSIKPTVEQAISNPQKFAVTKMEFVDPRRSLNINEALGEGQYFGFRSADLRKAFAVEADLIKEEARTLPLKDLKFNKFVVEPRNPLIIETEAQLTQLVADAFPKLQGRDYPVYLMRTNTRNPEFSNWAKAQGHDAIILKTEKLDTMSQLYFGADQVVLLDKNIPKSQLTDIYKQATKEADIFVKASVNPLPPPKGVEQYPMSARDFENWDPIGVRGLMGGQSETIHSVLWGTDNVTLQKALAQGRFGPGQVRAQNYKLARAAAGRKKKQYAEEVGKIFKGLSRLDQRQLFLYRDALSEGLAAPKVSAKVAREEERLTELIYDPIRKFRNEYADSVGIEKMGYQPHYMPKKAKLDKLDFPESEMMEIPESYAKARVGGQLPGEREQDIQKLTLGYIQNVFDRIYLEGQHRSLLQYSDLISKAGEAKRKAGLGMVGKDQKRFLNESRELEKAARFIEESITYAITPQAAENLVEHLAQMYIGARTTARLGGNLSFAVFTLPQSSMVTQGLNPSIRVIPSGFIKTFKPSADDIKWLKNSLPTLDLKTLNPLSTLNFGEGSIMRVGSKKQKINAVMGWLANAAEKRVSVHAAMVSRERVKRMKGATQEIIDMYSDYMIGATQSEYDKIARPKILRNLAVQVAEGFQRFSFEMYRHGKRFSGKGGGLPLEKRDRYVQAINLMLWMEAGNFVYEQATGYRLHTPASWIPLVGRFVTDNVINKHLRGQYTTRGQVGLYNDVEQVMGAIGRYYHNGDTAPLRRELINWGMGFTRIYGATTINRMIDGMIANMEGETWGIDRIIAPMLGPGRTRESVRERLRPSGTSSPGSRVRITPPSN